MQNCAIKAIRDAGVLREQNKPFNFDKILRKQSNASKDYRDFMHVLKQFLFLHNINAKKIHCNVYQSCLDLIYQQVSNNLLTTNNSHAQWYLSLKTKLQNIGITFPDAFSVRFILNMASRFKISTTSTFNIQFNYITFVARAVFTNYITRVWSCSKSTDEHECSLIIFIELCP